MLSDLAAQLDALPSALRARLDRHRFDRQRLLELAERTRRGEVDNRVAGRVVPPQAGDVDDLPPSGSARAEELREIGREALSSGHCALLVLAGGMATRMGGVVKALVEVLPGRTFLDLRLGEQRHWMRQSGAAVPLWLMTSEATDGPIRRALGSAIDDDAIAVFSQSLSVRFARDGALFVDGKGDASLHAPGHGDLPDALARTGLLDRFVARGGRYLMVANLDNLGATLDPLLVGYHLAGGAQVSCEVVDKLGSDRGGIPVRHDDRPVVLEEFRLPSDFDASRVRVFNTNTFHFDAPGLARARLEWTYFVVEKQVDGAAALQMERLLGEVTSHLDTRFVRVPRSGAESRFLPVKDHEELDRRRREIEQVAQARGLLESAL